VGAFVRSRPGVGQRGGDEQVVSGLVALYAGASDADTGAERVINTSAFRQLSLCGNRFIASVDAVSKFDQDFSSETRGQIRAKVVMGQANRHWDRSIVPP